MTTRQEIDFQEDIAAEPSRGGRPRDEAREQAILEAAIDLLAEVGYEAMSIESVAVRAKSSKATIYRRYRSKDELVSDAIATLVSEITIPDTGSTRADLRALMTQAIELYSGSLAARLTIARSRGSDSEARAQERMRLRSTETLEGMHSVTGKPRAAPSISSDLPAPP